jgi:hypothetical protein
MRQFGTLFAFMPARITTRALLSLLIAAFPTGNSERAKDMTGRRTGKTG